MQDSEWRIGTDGDRSWTIEKKSVRTNKSGEEVVTWQPRGYYSSVFRAAISLFELRSKQHFNYEGDLYRAIERAKRDVLVAVEKLGESEAKEEIKEAVEKR